MLTQGLASSLTHCFLENMTAAHEKRTGCTGRIFCCVSTSDAHGFKHVTDGDEGRAATPARQRYSRESLGGLGIHPAHHGLGCRCPLSVQAHLGHLAGPAHLGEECRVSCSPREATEGCMV